MTQPSETQERLKQIRTRLENVLPEEPLPLQVLLDANTLLYMIDTRAPVDSQGATIRDHYFVPTLVRDSCAKCGKGTDRHPGHDQVATQMRTACVETIRALRPSATGAGAFKDAAIKALGAVTLDQVTQKEQSK